MIEDITSIILNNINTISFSLITLSVMTGVVIDILRPKKHSFKLDLDGRKVSPKYLGRSYAYNLVDGLSEGKIKIRNNKYVSDFTADLTVYYTDHMGFEKGGLGGGGVSTAEDSETIRLEDEKNFTLENEEYKFAIVNIDDYNLNIKKEFDQVRKKRKRLGKISMFLLILSFAGFVILVTLL